MSQSAKLKKKHPEKMQALSTFEEFLPDKQVESGTYILRFVRSAEELDAVLQLRFNIFNVEIGEGLDESFDTGRDKDEFDEYFHHLMLIEKSSGEVVGTYRMQTNEMAAANGKGYYSADEFDLSTIPPDVSGSLVELGRACIVRNHRSMRALFMLWRGLAIYLADNHKDYFFGCTSLTSQDPVEGKMTMDYLKKKGYVHQTICVKPQPGFECYPENYDPPASAKVDIPKLLKMYLKIGSKVISTPAIDREFKTIDFLTMMDIRQLDSSMYKMFFK